MGLPSLMLEEGQCWNLRLQTLMSLLGLLMNRDLHFISVPLLNSLRWEWWVFLFHNSGMLFESSPWATTLLCKTYLSTCFYELKEIWREFSLLWKKTRNENMFSVCFGVSHYGGGMHPRHRDGGTAKLLPAELHTASSPQTTATWNCVCEHLCFVLIYRVRPLARCVLR